MNKLLLISSILINLIHGCAAQTNEEKIRETTNKVLTAFKNGNEKEFEELNGGKLLQMGKDKELISYDFEKCEHFYTSFLGNHKVEIVITDEYSELGTRKVIIPFYKGNDTLNNVSEVTLELYFGPPNFVSLDKLTDYKLIVEYIHTPTIIVSPFEKN